MLPDSCAGWPAVNHVSNRPLLLLIVSISVPVEKWDCCGQTQAIDLWLVHDLPAARVQEWEWRPGWSLHDTPCLAPVPGKATVVIYTSRSNFLHFSQSFKFTLLHLPIAILLQSKNMFSPIISDTPIMCFHRMILVSHNYKVTSLLLPSYSP